MKEHKSKSKQIGQVFTPRYLVENILNYCDYMGKQILRKHVIDNSCGDGAFLTVVVERYCKEAIQQRQTLADIKKDLETDSHGIDTDLVAFNDCTTASI